MQTAPIRLLLVDDSELALRNIRSVLSGHDDVAIVGESKTGEEAIKRAGDLHPEVILLDIRLPGISGIEAANIMQSRVPESRIVFVSQHDSPLLAKDALLAGAYGYVVKANAAQDLWPAIEAAHSGRTFVSPTLQI